MSSSSYSPASSSRSSQAPMKPSRVLHFRNVQQPITQAQVLELCQSKGPVEYIMMLPNSNQAFVQFQTIESATNFLSEAQRYPPKIHDIPLYVQYSVHDTISTKPSPRAPGSPSRVLLVTIHNPLYTITLDVLSKIFSPYESNVPKQVEKIIIFQRRTGLQALVQFSDVESATAAMHNLDGKNIYKSCCMLQIQFSKQQELTVVENNEHFHDYTNPNLPERKAKALLPQSGAISSFSGMGNMGYSSFPPSVPGMMQGMPPMGMGGSMSGMSPSSMGGAMGVPSMYRNVVIVSGFPPDKIGCDQLFNLFSNYGNIVRIKILHDKPNTALIQFTDYAMASNAVLYLKDVPVCGSPLNVNFSKFPTISPSKEVRTQIMSGARYKLTHSEGRASSDGRTVEYEESSLNRFHRNMQANLHHATAPTPFLHLSNLSSSVTEDTIRDFLERIAKPVAVKLFEKSNRLMAIVQMPSIELAVNSVCFLHNEVVEGRNIRLALTKSRI